MQLSRSQAVGLFQALGRQAAAGWKKSQMEANIKSLPDLVDGNTEIGDKQLDELLDNVLGALAEGEPVELVADHVAAVTAEAADGDGGSSQEKAAPEEKEEMATATKPAAKPAKKTAKPAAKPAKKADKAAKPTKSAKGPTEGLKGVRAEKSALYIAGALIKKHGLKNGVSKEMAHESCKLRGRKDVKQDFFNLRHAWHAIQGYLQGDI